jgi:hypothetical protein
VIGNPVELSLARRGKLIPVSCGQQIIEDRDIMIFGLDELTLDLWSVRIAPKF